MTLNWTQYHLPRCPSGHTVRQSVLFAIQWAVWLGANTPKRLAREWGVSHRNALYWLTAATKAGLLRRRRGAGRAPSVYRVSRMLVGMNDRSTG